MKPNYFKLQNQKLKLPLFFPDATRAVLRTVDSVDIENTRTPGILVNTYHLWNELGKQALKNHGGIRKFMSWDGAVISDSGGFQIMTLAKTAGKHGKITDEGVMFQYSKKKKVFFTPEDSIRFQMLLKTDLLVVLDDFTPPGADRRTAQETVERTVLWAKKCKKEFDKICKQQKLPKNKRPYLIAVVQGGDFLDLRKECAQRLAEIGFDGFGYGGWPITAEGKLNPKITEYLPQITPQNYLLYGLGVGKPEDIVRCVQLGYHIFDCVLPTRDARHKRLYVYNATSLDKINLDQSRFYSYYTPNKKQHVQDDQPVSLACDCLLCTHYSRAYLAHLFKIKEMTALRLATIHNLRFYSFLMEKLRKK